VSLNNLVKDEFHCCTGTGSSSATRIVGDGAANQQPQQKDKGKAAFKPLPRTLKCGFRNIIEKHVMSF